MSDLTESDGKVDGVTLSVRRWSAWAPGLQGVEAWRRWASGERSIEGDASPDVGFVPPLLRRRLGRETRSAFRVAEDCLQGEVSTPAYVFCSRYGEFTRTFDLLSALAEETPLSANAFSMSVHNTAASLFSINRGDHGVSSSVASGESTLETAFVEAWSLLSAGEAETALIVYFDAPLPDGYRQRGAGLDHPLAVAMLVELSKDEDCQTGLSLRWNATDERLESDGGLGGSALGIVRLLLEPGPPIESAVGRMRWEWSRGPEKPIFSN